MPWVTSESEVSMASSLYVSGTPMGLVIDYGEGGGSTKWENRRS